MLDQIDPAIAGRCGRPEVSVQAAGGAAALVGRARRDFSRGSCRRALPRDRATDATRAVDRGARDPGQWRAATLPSLARGSTRRATYPTPEGAQAGALSAAPGGSGTPPPAALVATTDRSAARGGLSRRSSHAGVARNHLPIPVRADARGPAP